MDCMSSEARMDCMSSEVQLTTACGTSEASSFVASEGSTSGDEAATSVSPAASVAASESEEEAVSSGGDTAGEAPTDVAPQQECASNGPAQRTRSFNRKHCQTVARAPKTRMSRSEPAGNSVPSSEQLAGQVGHSSRQTRASRHRPAKPGVESFPQGGQQHFADGSQAQDHTPQGLQRLELQGFIACNLCGNLSYQRHSCRCRLPQAKAMQVLAPDASLEQQVPTADEHDSVPLSKLASLPQSREACSGHSGSQSAPVEPQKPCEPACLSGPPAAEVAAAAAPSSDDDDDMLVPFRQRRLSKAGHRPSIIVDDANDVPESKAGKGSAPKDGDAPGHVAKEAQPWHASRAAIELLESDEEDDIGMPRSQHAAPSVSPIVDSGALDNDHEFADRIAPAPSSRKRRLSRQAQQGSPQDETRPGSMSEEQAAGPSSASGARQRRVKARSCKQPKMQDRIKQHQQVALGNAAASNRFPASEEADAMLSDSDLSEASKSENEAATVQQPRQGRSQPGRRQAASPSGSDSGLDDDLGDFIADDDEAPAPDLHSVGDELEEEEVPPRGQRRKSRRQGRRSKKRRAPSPSDDSRGGDSGGDAPDEALDNSINDGSDGSGDKPEKHVPDSRPHMQKRCVLLLVHLTHACLPCSHGTAQMALPGTGVSTSLWNNAPDSCMPAL